MSPQKHHRNPSPARQLPSAIATAAMALTAALILAACNKPEGQPAGGKPGAPEVGVVTVQAREIGLVTELPGRLEASRSRGMRARAAGILQKVASEAQRCEGGSDAVPDRRCALPGEPGPG